METQYYYKQYMVLNQIFGLVTASVYGRMESYARMTDNVCKASHKSLMNDLGISKHTLITAIKKLVDAQLIKDLTPGLRNRPHIYKMQNVDNWCAKNAHQYKQVCKISTLGVQNFDDGVQNLNDGVQNLPDRCAKIALESDILKDKEIDILKAEGNDFFVDALSAETGSSHRTTKKDVKENLKQKIESSFNIFASGKAWERFLEFAYEKQQAGQDIDVFIGWALNNGFNPIYWSPEKMMNLWPKSFSEKQQSERNPEYVVPAPFVDKEENKNYIPMPKHIGKRSTDDEEVTQTITVEEGYWQGEEPEDVSYLFEEKEKENE
jgi:hypothetical protein